MHRDARRPRRIGARALLAPFDPLIWTLKRTERLFGFRINGDQPLALVKDFEA